MTDNTVQQLYQLCRTLLNHYKPLASLTNCTNIQHLSDDQRNELQRVLQSMIKQSGGNDAIANIEKSLGLNQNTPNKINNRNISSTVKRNIISLEKETAKLAADLQSFTRNVTKPLPGPNSTGSSSTRGPSGPSGSSSTRGPAGSLSPAGSSGSSSTRGPAGSLSPAGSSGSSSPVVQSCTLAIAYFQKKIDIIQLCRKMLPTKSTSIANPCITRIQSNRLGLNSPISKTYLKVVNTCLKILNYMQSKPVIKVKTMDYFIVKLNQAFDTLYAGCRRN